MTTGKNGVLTKIVLTACISIICTMTITWFTFGQGVVNRTYLEHYDKNFSIWAKDKDVITEKLNNINRQNDEALSLIQILKIDVSDIKFEQKVMADELKKHSIQDENKDGH